MQAVTLGLNHQLAQYNSIDPQPASGNTGGAMDPAQLQQLVQLLGAKMLPKQTAVVECPKSMVGRVIGKGGETIKALQQYTGAMIQIDQSTDPTRVTIAGSPQSLQLAVSMVNDIVRGTFKGFAMLRQIAIGTQGTMAQFGQPQPVYVQGYGFVPPSQVYNPEESLSASLLRGSPSGAMTPPMPGGMRPGVAPPGSNLPADALAALLGQPAQGPSGGHVGGSMTPPYGAPAPQPPPQAGSGSDALIAQLLSQLASQGMPTPTQGPPQMQMAPQQQAPQQQPQQPQRGGAPDLSNLADLDPSTLQALLAQAGLLGGGPGAQPGLQQQVPPMMPSSSQQQGLPPSAALMMAAAQAGAGGPPLAMHTPTSPSPSGSPYTSGSHAGMLSMMMGGAGQTLGSRPLSSAGSVGSPPYGGMTPPPMSGSMTPPPMSGSMTPPPMSAPPPAAGTSTLTGLLQGTNAASSFLGTSPSSASSPASGSGRTSPAKPPLASTPGSAPATSLKSNSGESSPMGRFGAIGSGVGVGGASSSGGGGVVSPLGPAVGGPGLRPEEALAAKMGALSTSDSPAGAQLPPGWTKVADTARGLVYYVNTLTGESSLTPPAPASTNGVQQNM